MQMMDTVFDDEWSSWTQLACNFEVKTLSTNRDKWSAPRHSVLES
jgi:hypothetical protein